MELQEAKDLFEEIVEIIYDLDNPKMISAVEAIYSDASRAKSMGKLFMSLEELIVMLEDIDLNSDEEDALKDIQEKIEQMGE